MGSGYLGQDWSYSKNLTAISKDFYRGHPVQLPEEVPPVVYRSMFGILVLNPRLLPTSPPPRTGQS